MKTPCSLPLIGFCEILPIINRKLKRIHDDTAWNTLELSTCMSFCNTVCFHFTAIPILPDYEYFFSQILLLFC